MRKAICIMVILVLMAGLTSCGKSKLEKSNERLAETFSHIAGGAERWDNMVNGTEDTSDSEETWTEHVRQYFPDAKVEESGSTINIEVSAKDQEPDEFMFLCSSVFEKLEGCESGTMVKIKIKDDSGSMIVASPNEDGLFGFESTAILPEGSPLQKSYDEMFMANDSEFLQDLEDIQNEKEQVQSEIEEILGEDIFE